MVQLQSPRAAAAFKKARSSLLIETLEPRRLLAAAPFSAPVMSASAVRPHLIEQSAATSLFVSRSASIGQAASNAVADPDADSYANCTAVVSTTTTRSSAPASISGDSFHLSFGHTSGDVHLRSIGGDALIVVVHDYIAPPTTGTVIVYSGASRTAEPDEQYGWGNTMMPGGDATPPPRSAPPAPGGTTHDGYESYPSGDQPGSRPASRPDVLRQPRDLGNGAATPDTSSYKVTEATARTLEQATSARPASSDDRVSGSRDSATSQPAKAVSVRPASDSEGSRSGPIVAVYGSSSEGQATTSITAQSLVARPSTSTLAAAAGNLAIRAANTFFADLPLSEAPAGGMDAAPQVGTADALGAATIAAQGTLLGLVPWKMPQVKDAEEWGWWEAIAVGSLIVTVSGFYYCRMVSIVRQERERAAATGRRKQRFDRLALP